MKKMTVLFLVVLLANMNAIVLRSQTSAKSEDTVENLLCCTGKVQYNIPDLTDEQKKRIEDLQLAHMKEVNKTKAQLSEKQAHLRTLQLADKTDNAAINKTIDEITALKNDLMKKHEAHRQAVRSLLTEKQKVVFDAKGTNYMRPYNNCGGSCKGRGCADVSEQKSYNNKKSKGCCNRN